MGGIADHGLVEIAYLNINSAFQVGHGSKIANMAITAYPNRWSFREGLRKSFPATRRT